VKNTEALTVIRRYLADRMCTHVPINMPARRADTDSVTRFSLRMFKRPTREDAGFSMVEVVVSLLIIGIVATASAGFFVANIKDVNGQRQHQEAVYLADQQIETVQSLPSGLLVQGRTQTSVNTLFATSAATALNIAGQDDTSNSGNYDTSGATTPTIQTISSPAVTVNAVPYTLYTFIDVCWFAVASGTCGPTQSASTVKEYRASVYVSWTVRGPCSNGCNYSTSTLIDPNPDPTFNTNLSQPALLTGPTPATVNNANQYTSSCTTAAGTDTGTEVVLNGTNLKSGVRVWISSGGGTISQISQPNSTEVDFCLQAGDQPGSYTLSIINTDGGHFQTSITEVPNIAGAAGWSPSGGTLTLSGGGFETGATLSASTGATFGSTNVVAGSGALDTMVIQNFSGPTNGASSTLTLTNPDGTSATYKVIAPTESSYTSVPQGRVNGAWVLGQTTSLTVTGTNFKSGTGTGVVTNGNGTVTETRLSSTSEQVILTGATVGTETVEFFNADGGTSSTFSIPVDPAPTVTSSTPGVTVVGTGTVVTVNGTFLAPVTASASLPGSISVVSSSASQVILTVTPTSSGADTITLTAADGGTVTVPLTVDPLPSVTSASPATVGAAIPTTVTLTGSGFQAGMTVAQSAPGSVTIVSSSSTSLVLNVTANTTKTDTFTLTNPDGGTTTYSIGVAPTVTTLTASPSIKHSTATTWTVTGTGFVTTGTTTITLKEGATTLTVSSVAVASTTSITFKATTTASTTSQSFVLTVTNPDGSTVSKTQAMTPA
jgi:prepilin-type N-terminal cleavage/methylation domain-containing protein